MAGQNCSVRDRNARETNEKLRVVNIGLQTFADAISVQKAKVTQLDWRPPIEQSKEMEELLDLLL